MLNQTYINLVHDNKYEAERFLSTETEIEVRILLRLLSLDFVDNDTVENRYGFMIYPDNCLRIIEYYDNGTTYIYYLRELK